MNITLYRADTPKKVIAKPCRKPPILWQTQPCQKPNRLAPTPNHPSPKASSQSELTPHPRITHIIVVASGKGGWENPPPPSILPWRLQNWGNVRAYWMQIFIPSIPSMLGVAVQPQLENEQFVPIEAHGMPMLSIGSLLTDDNTPVAWRGAKATGALMQLYNQTNYHNLITSGLTCRQVRVIFS